MDVIIKNKTLKVLTPKTDTTIRIFYKKNESNNLKKCIILIAKVQDTSKVPNTWFLILGRRTS